MKTNLSDNLEVFSRDPHDNLIDLSGFNVILMSKKLDTYSNRVYLLTSHGNDLGK